jgi:phage protein D
MRQEQEIYHHLYKDKLEMLAKQALAERLPELQNIPNSSDEEGESDADSDGQDSSKGKGAEASSLQKIRALRMKIRREVRAEAWANETAEVRREVKEAMMREREGVAEINGDENKVGLERSPESREL